MLQEAKKKAVEKKIIFKCKGAFKNVLDNHVEKKSRHQILMEGVNKLSLENKEACQFLAKQKQTHELRKLAEQAKQDAHEKRCQESQRPSWFENSVNNKIVDQKASQKGLLRFDELRKSGAIKIETPRRKIIIRKSAPQQFQPRYLKPTKASQAPAEPEPEVNQAVVNKFVKEINMKPRNSLLTPPSLDDNNTTASNSINTRPFGNSVKGVHRRFFSDVNQRDVFDEKSESEENDCPFDVAIDEIEEQNYQEESPLKLKKQQSSDTLLQGKSRYVENLSRNNDESGMKIRHLKRRSHIPTNSSLG